MAELMLMKLPKARCCRQMCFTRRRPRSLILVMKLDKQPEEFASRASLIRHSAARGFLLISDIPSMSCRDKPW